MTTHYVTGSSGFIGGALCERLEGDGESIIRLDFAETDEAAILVKLLEAGEDDTVYLIGAYPNVADSALHPADDVSRNLRPVVSQMEAANGAGHVVFASSFGGLFETGDDIPIHEGDTPWPIAPYFIGKLAGEQYLRLVRADRSWAALRLANVYGPSPCARGVVSDWMRALPTGEPFQRCGATQTTRDYLYIDDAVDAFVRAGRNWSIQGVFHIGTGQRTTLGELAELIDPAHPIEEIESRPGDWIEGARVDAGRAARVLGWRPHITLEEGLRLTRVWYRAQP